MPCAWPHACDAGIDDLSLPRPPLLAAERAVAEGGEIALRF